MDLFAPVVARLRVRSIAPAARQWLASTGGARILHGFRQAVNLVNGEGSVLSLVSPRLGNGPFTAIVPGLRFEDPLSPDLEVDVSGGKLQFGGLRIEVDAGTATFNPRPDWEKIATRKFVGGYTQSIADLLSAEATPDSLAALIHQRSPTLNPQVAARARDGIRSLALPESRVAAAQALAGLGPGLTPAGDDLLVGFMVAAWACQPEGAAPMCQPLADAASPLTNTLSRAWLAAAARGEAGEVWHIFMNALTGGDAGALLAAARRILPTGHTSGADALAGFLLGLDALR